MCVGIGDTTHKGHKQWESVFSSHSVGPGIKHKFNPVIAGPSLRPSEF